jgi:protein SCO1/2
MKPGLWITIGVALALAASAAAVVRVRHGEHTGAAIGGPFELVEAKSQRRFSDHELRGAPAAMFFGFTHCPDVCPMALSVATRWLKALGPDARRLHFVFVTVDPERDTPEHVAQYLQSFDPRIIGLTGTRAQIDAVLERYRIVAEKNASPSGDGYSYDHTALIQLFDARGGFAGTLDFEDPDDLALAKLRALIRGGSITVADDPLRPSRVARMRS